MGVPRLTWDGYAAAWARLHDGFDLRHASPAVRGWLRVAYGIGRVLARARVPRGALVAAALLLNLAVPVTVLLAGDWLAAALVLVAAMVDNVGAAVAVLTSTMTRLGLLYGSLVHRLAELSWLAALWVLGAPVWLLAGCGAAAWLHEYLRARAAAVGLPGVGAMTAGERSTRLAATVGGLAFAGVAGRVSAELEAGAATIAAVVWIFLGLFGIAELLSGLRKPLR